MLRQQPLVRDLRNMPRRFGGFRLNTIGYVPRKTEVVDHAFNSVNYSLILSGRGSLRMDQQVIRVEAPCVITQFPGVHVIYGPPAGWHWEELFIMLPPESLSGLQRRALFSENPHLWAIRDPAEVMHGVKALLSAIEHPDARPGWVDRIDHQAERLLMDTLLPGEEAHDAGAAMVKWLARMMASSPGKHYDLHDIAHEQGLSYSTFQRRWREQFDLPPGRHLLNLRLSESCRLLVETDMTAAEIGVETGFEDPGYFSRMFKEHIGMPPSRYRKLYRPG